MFSNPPQVSGQDFANSSYWSAVGENAKGLGKWYANVGSLGIVPAVGYLARGGQSEEDIKKGMMTAASVNFQKTRFFHNLQRDNADIFSAENTQVDSAFSTGGKVIGQASKNDDIGWYMARLEEAYTKGNEAVVAELVRIRREQGGR